MTLLLNAGACAPTARSVPPDAVDYRKADDAVNIADLAGLRLFPWQEDVLRSSLMVRAADYERWAAREVALSVSRQAGKGSILEARQLAGLFVIGERLQVHSAHEFKTCYEHFRRVVSLIEGCDLLLKQVKIIRTGAGDQAIELTNGNRLRFIARSRSSGRGFSADAVYLDEAFELSTETMGALLPALSARPNPQVWYTSSAAHKSSTVLHSVRKRGLAGDDPRLFYVEWSNDPDADPADPESWRRANPSLGLLVSEEDIAAEQRSLDPAEFARERLGIPEEPESTASVIALDAWNALEDKGSEAAGRVVLALDVSPDRKWSTISAAGRRDDGLLHVESVTHKPGTSWVVAEVPTRLAEAGCDAIRIEKGGPAASLIPLLAEAGVAVDEVSTADHARATGQFIDAVADGRLRHLGQQSLRSAVVAAKLRATGDAELWSRRSSKMDITPLVAATLALGGVPEASEPARQPLYFDVV
jgi:phage terminase large subunit-like protein